MASYYMNEPTIKPATNFNVAEDADALLKAMKGLGTDEQVIIDILTKRSNEQRRKLTEYYMQEYGKDLVKELKSELGGNLEDVIIGLMFSPLDYMCQELNKALKKSTDNQALIDILCTRNNKQVKEIVDKYETLFDRPLVEHICSETKGDFRKLMTLVATGVRNSPGKVTPGSATEQADALYKAGEAKLGTNEEVFNKILAHESYEQLRLVMEEYKKVAGRTLEQAIKDEISGPLHDAYMAILECVTSQATYFAKTLHKSMAGLGTNDSTLKRIIVSRSEIDLGNIKKEYERLYGKTLESVVKSETSGDYKRSLVALIGGA